MNHQDIIKINDSVYDAKTGRLISGPKIEVSAVKKQSAKPRQAAQHNHARSLEQSKTLMRKAVKKPKAQNSKNNTKASLPIKHESVLSQKISARNIHPEKLSKASSIVKSSKISKFAKTTAAPHTDREVIIKSVPHKSDRHTKLPKKAKTTEDLLMHAVERAKTHEQTYKKSHRKKTKINKTYASAAIGALVLIIVTLSLPFLQLKMASSQAGFDIKRPAYKAAGFKYQGLKAQPGNADLYYRSNSDDRQYVISQKISNWDNGVLNKVLGASTETTQIQTPKGRQVYITPSGSAQWVINGFEYDITTNNTLSNRQIVEIVDSL